LRSPGGLCRDSSGQLKFPWIGSASGPRRDACTQSPRFFIIASDLSRPIARVVCRSFIGFISHFFNKKHLKNVGPIRHCEPPHAVVLHCHSPGVNVARRLRYRCPQQRRRQQRQRVIEGTAMGPHRMGPKHTWLLRHFYKCTVEGNVGV